MGRKNSRRQFRYYGTYYVPGGTHVLCDCGKRGYESEESAEEAAAIMRKSGKAKRKTRVYFCETKYHYTTMPLKTFNELKKVGNNEQH